MTEHTEESYRVKFSERLSLAMERSGETSASVADKISSKDDRDKQRNSKQSSVIQWRDNGAKVPTFDNIIRLCNALNVSADWLLGLTGESDNEGSIEWATKRPLPDNKFIHLGVEAFKELVTGNTFEEVYNSLGQPQYYIELAVRAAFQSNAIQITHVRKLEGKTLEGIRNALKTCGVPEKNIIVADINDNLDSYVREECIAFLAAQEILTNITTPALYKSGIGIGNGYLIQRMSKISLPNINLSGASWISMSPTLEGDEFHLTSNYLARLLSNQHPGTMTIHYPYGESEESIYPKKPQDMHVPIAILQAEIPKNSNYVSRILGMDIKKGDAEEDIEFDEGKGKAIGSEIIQWLKKITSENNNLWILALGANDDNKAKQLAISVKFALENGLANAVLADRKTAEKLYEEISPRPRKEEQDDNNS